MCPGTLALTAAVMGAGGSIMQGISSGNAANYQAQVASNNRTIQQQNAIYSAGATSSAITVAGLKERAKQANLRASMAANGVDVNSGSAADVQQSERVLGGLDVANTGARGAREVYGYETKAADYQAQANLDRSQASNDYFSGAYGAATKLIGSPDFDKAASGGFSSLMGGPSSVSDNYAWMRDSGESDAVGGMLGF